MKAMEEDDGKDNGQDRSVGKEPWFYLSGF